MLRVCRFNPIPGGGGGGGLEDGYIYLPSERIFLIKSEPQ